MAASTQIAVPATRLQVTSKDILGALRELHAKRTGEWVCVPEAFSGWTSRSGGIDLLAAGAWRSAKAKGLPGAGSRTRPHVAVAYEIKVSRSDMRRDLYGYTPTPGTEAARVHRIIEPWPAKQADALRLTNYFLFAVPQGMLHEDEIARRTPWATSAEHGDDLFSGQPPRRGALYLPAEVGLIEVDPRGRCIVRADATYTERDEWTAPLTFELLRRAQYLGKWWNPSDLATSPEGDNAHE